MSISSSNDRIANLPFGRIWLLTGITLVLFFIGWNCFWFSNKVIPLPDDDAKLWSYHRRRVSDSGNKTVVLIGSSRIQTGLDQSVFTKFTGRKTIQLAIIGQSPIPTLQNLADDETFQGTVISDFSEFIVYQNEMDQNSRQTVTAWIREYQEGKMTDDFEFWLRGYGRYLVAHPYLGTNPADSLKNIFTGQVFHQKTIDEMNNHKHSTFFDRTMIFKMGDFLTKEEEEDLIKKLQKAPVESMRYLIENNPPKPEKIREIINNIEGLVQKIQSRGGKVVFVNFPMSGELARLNDIAFPREKFWDVLTANTTAETFHYKDYPQLQFECPDGSHLKAEDTPQFTENLVKIIYGIQ